MTLIGITGGIGSGKSVVSRILRLRGEAVYDCDLEAKRIMDESEEVLTALNERFGDEVCPVGGPIDRKALSRHVFGSDEHRLWLNSLVHRLVREDIILWSKVLEESGATRCYVESAILATSGLTAICDEIWIVTAPEKERIERVKGRDGLDEEDIRKRIESQKEEQRLVLAAGIPVRTIDNGSKASLLSPSPALPMGEGVG